MADLPNSARWSGGENEAGVLSWFKSPQQNPLLGSGKGRDRSGRKAWMETLFISTSIFLGCLRLPLASGRILTGNKYDQKSVAMRATSKGQVTIPRHIREKLGKSRWKIQCPSRNRHGQNDNGRNNETVQGQPIHVYPYASFEILAKSEVCPLMLMLAAKLNMLLPYCEKFTFFFRVTIEKEMTQTCSKMQPYAREGIARFIGIF